MEQENIISAISNLASLKAEIDRIEKKAEALQAEIVAAMKESGESVIEDDTIRGSLVEVEKVVIDEVALEVEVGPRMWNDITTRKLNKKALESQILLDRIDKKMVAKLSKITNNKPYVRITKKSA